MIASAEGRAEQRILSCDSLEERFDDGNLRIEAGPAHPVPLEAFRGQRVVIELVRRPLVDSCMGFLDNGIAAIGRVEVLP